jgi:RNA polymerase sigma factor (sigma-70 family)
MSQIVTTPQEARFHALYTDYRKPIRRRIQYILKQDNLVLTEDVEQDTWGKIWRALPGTDKTSFRWCSVIATNAAKDALRKRYHIYHGKQASLPVSLDETTKEGTLVYETIEANMPDLADLTAWREEVHSLLIRMTQQERRILFLFHAGYSAKELEAEFAISTDETYRAMRRIYGRMRYKQKREQTKE